MNKLNKEEHTLSITQIVNDAYGKRPTKKRTEAMEKLGRLLKDAFEYRHQQLMQTPKTILTPFERVINDRMERTKHLLLVKGKEYVRNNDRFHNFNRTAEMNRITPTRALHGMLSKHLVSIFDILDDIDKGILPSEESVSEKIGDAIVYLHLQEALIKSQISNKLNSK